MFAIASGSVCLIAVAASLPLAWNAEPTFPPWLLTPETTCPPWDLTFPDVSPETLDATFALPSAAASFAPPPPPDWPWTEEAAESIVPLTFWPEAVTADLPWLAKSAPVCVAALAASSTALLVLVVAEPFQVVTWPLAVAPAAVTLPFAPAIAARDLALGPRERAAHRAHVRRARLGHLALVLADGLRDRLVRALLGLLEPLRLGLRGLRDRRVDVLAAFLDRPLALALGFARLRGRLVDLRRGVALAEQRRLVLAAELVGLLGLVLDVVLGLGGRGLGLAALGLATGGLGAFLLAALRRSCLSSPSFSAASGAAASLAALLALGLGFLVLGGSGLRGLRGGPLRLAASSGPLSTRRGLRDGGGRRGRSGGGRRGGGSRGFRLRAGSVQAPRPRARRRGRRRRARRWRAGPRRRLPARPWRRRVRARRRRAWPRRRRLGAAAGGRGRGCGRAALGARGAGRAAAVAGARRGVRPAPRRGPARRRPAARRPRRPAARRGPARRRRPAARRPSPAPRARVGAAAAAAVSGTVDSGAAVPAASGAAASAAAASRSGAPWAAAADSGPAPAAEASRFGEAALGAAAVGRFRHRDGRRGRHLGGGRVRRRGRRGGGRRGRGRLGLGGFRPRGFAGLVAALLRRGRLGLGGDVLAVVLHVLFGALRRGLAAGGLGEDGFGVGLRVGGVGLGARGLLGGRGGLRRVLGRLGLGGAVGGSAAVLLGHLGRVGLDRLRGRRLGGRGRLLRAGLGGLGGAVGRLAVALREVRVLGRDRGGDRRRRDARVLPAALTTHEVRHGRVAGALLHREHLLHAHAAGQRALRHRRRGLGRSRLCACGRGLLRRELFYSLRHPSDPSTNSSTTPECGEGYETTRRFVAPNGHRFGHSPNWHTFVANACRPVTRVRATLRSCHASVQQRPWEGTG